MGTRERRNSNEPERPRMPDGSSDDDLNELSNIGEGFLTAADRAIDNALSVDSEAFLRQNRQHGGQ